MPKRLTKDESGATETYAKFIAEPFETGYGHTVANSLRRVLLSSLEGAAITSVKIDFSYQGDDVLCLEATVRVFGRTGVEMEALTAVSVAALTVYDMCKAVDRVMTVERVRLEEKSGGRSGTFRRDD